MGDIRKMQDKMNEHDKEMMKVTRTLQNQIDEKDQTIEKYKLILKKKKTEAENEKNRLKDNFDNQKKNEDQK